MSFPAQIVHRLLEDDPDFDADEYMATPDQELTHYGQPGWPQDEQARAARRIAAAQRAADARAAREDMRDIGPPIQWANVLGNRPRKKLDRNTYLVREYDSISVKLYDTNILTAQPNGDVSVNMGGYRTVTTTDRINKFLPHGWKLCVRQGQDFWFNWETGAGRLESGYSIPFTDGDVILNDGTLQNQEPQIPLRQRRQRVQP
jgi:hypothetical protein